MAPRQRLPEACRGGRVRNPKPNRTARRAWVVAISPWPRLWSTTTAGGTIDSIRRIFIDNDLFLGREGPPSRRGHFRHRAESLIVSLTRQPGRPDPVAPIPPRGSNASGDARKSGSYALDKPWNGDLYWHLDQYPTFGTPHQPDPVAPSGQGAAKLAPAGLLLACTGPAMKCKVVTTPAQQTGFSTGVSRPEVIMVGTVATGHSSPRDFVAARVRLNNPPPATCL